MNSDNKEKKVNTAPEALSDEALDKAVGGAYFTEHPVNSREEVRFLFKAGDIVYVDDGLYFFTQRCRVVRTEVFDRTTCGLKGFTDTYVVESLDYKPGDFSYIFTRIGRQDIKMT